MKEKIDKLTEVRAILREARNISIKASSRDLNDILDKIARCDFGDNVNDLSRDMDKTEERLLKLRSIKFNTTKFRFAVFAAVVGWCLFLFKVFNSPCPPCP